MVTTGLLTNWMGCAVDPHDPHDAAIAGAPAFVLLSGISVCDTAALVGVSWPAGEVTGVLRNLEVNYWAMAALPGDVPLVVAGGHRRSEADGTGRLYFVNVQTMAVIDSSPPIVVGGLRNPWVEVIWTDDSDRGFALTSDARVAF
jgi:hypothetical protein